VNYGVAGQTCATMITNGATKVDPLYSASRNQNICVCFAGTNDMAIGGVSAATAIARLSQYCSDRRSAGWKVVVCTILPRGDNDIETRRATVNADILASVGVYSDAVANVAGDSRIGDSGDEDDLTYYSADTVHPNAAGAAVIAGIVQAAIESLAASGGTYRMDNRLMRPRRY